MRQLQQIRIHKSGVLKNKAEYDFGDGFIELFDFKYELAIFKNKDKELQKLTAQQNNLHNQSVVIYE